METCPGCDRLVDGLYPVPPESTKELIDDFEAVESPADLEACGECLDRLMQGLEIA